jgi:ribose 5-phosphate isomerase A
MTSTLSPQDRAKYLASRAALAEVTDGMKLGLGTGSTAAWLVKLVAEKCRIHGISVTCVPTSEATGALAQSLGLPLATLEKTGTLDLTIDGTDEFDPALNLIKGGGAAHLREKIVALSSARMVVITDATKESPQLGSFPLPLEVLDFGMSATIGHIRRALATQGLGDVEIVQRMKNGAPVRTDEGNAVLDAHLAAIPDAAALAMALDGVTGLVEHGLFIGIAEKICFADLEGNALTIDKEGSRQQVTFNDGIDEDDFLARALKG